MKYFIAIDENIFWACEKKDFDMALATINYFMPDFYFREIGNMSCYFSSNKFDLLAFKINDDFKN